MKWHRRSRNRAILWGLVILAIIFYALFYIRLISTGSSELDGLIGVCLGLFISAQPAANLLDMLLFGQEIQRWRELNRAEITWLVMNLSVLLVGLIVIILGTKLFFKNWQ